MRTPSAGTHPDHLICACSDANDECCKGCRIVGAGSVCRRSQSVCQRDVLCDGRSAECADTPFLKDGSACADASGSGTCASGRCTSRDAQCAAIGARLGLEQACPETANSCKIVCREPGSSRCVALDANFIDGTPCGQSGLCYQGSCTENGTATPAECRVPRNGKEALGGRDRDRGCRGAAGNGLPDLRGLQ